MKKSELKKELEIAKATLELAMVALRVAAEKNNLKSAINPPMIPIDQLKRLMDIFNKNQTIIPKSEPQAGDKIVESEYPDYVCIKDFDFLFKAKKGQTLSYCPDASSDRRPYYFNVDDMNSGIYPFSLFKANPTHFQKVEPKKETPLSDLNKEVQEELSKKNDLSCKQPETSKDESYVIQAKEAVDKFMPLVNGWKQNYPVGLTESSKILWSLSDYNHKKAAIKVAIKHFELIQKQGGWLTHIDCVQIIHELNKMLSQ